MNLDKQFVKHLGNGEIYFNVDSDHLRKNIDFIKDHNIKNINLNPFKGYTLKNINWIGEINGINKLEMSSCTISNFEGLSQLTSLEELIFSAEKKQPADLSSLKKLKTLSFEYHDQIYGLECLEKLEHLSVWKADSNLLNKSYFQKFIKLRYLKIVQSKFPKSLDFLINNNLLEILELHHCKTLIELLGLEKMNKSIEIVKITSCKKINNIELVGKLKKLKSFILSESVPIRNINFIEKLPLLDTLSLYGSSYCIDGDFRKLKNQFKNLNIQNKKHYIYPQWY